MNRAYRIIALIALLLAGSAAGAAPLTSILVKDSINAKGWVPMVMAVYDAPEGGRVLYETTRSVDVRNRLFVDVLEVPSDILGGHSQVFVEFALAKSPQRPLRPQRMPFAVPPSQQSPGVSIAGVRAVATVGTHVLAAESVCFTCGGAYPYQAGALATRSGGPNIERGRGCGGGLRTTTTDNRPFLCYGTCEQQALCSLP